MASSKLLSLTLLVTLICCAFVSRHQAEAGKLEKLAALALILRGQMKKGGGGGGGGHHAVAIPIHHHKKKKKHNIKVEFKVHDIFDKKDLEKLGEQLSSGHYSSKYW